MSNISVFGATGYIGSTFMRMYPNNILVPRGDRQPQSKDILYLISTTTNQNVFQDLQIDIDTNLKIPVAVIAQQKL